MLIAQLSIPPIAYLLGGLGAVVLCWDSLKSLVKEKLPVNPVAPKMEPTVPTPPAPVPQSDVSEALAHVVALKRYTDSKGMDLAAAYQEILAVLLDVGPVKA